MGQCASLWDWWPSWHNPDDDALSSQYCFEAAFGEVDAVVEDRVYFRRAQDTFDVSRAHASS